MAITAPVLDGNTLNHVSGYTETMGHDGATLTMADNSVVTQYSSTTVRRVARLTWSNITTTQRDTIDTALQALVDDADGIVSFTTPDGDTFNVSRDSAVTPVTWSGVRSSTGIRWTGTLVLREST